jgi:hypothetical protein
MLLARRVRLNIVILLLPPARLLVVGNGVGVGVGVGIGVGVRTIL